MCQASELRWNTYTPVCGRAARAHVCMCTVRAIAISLPLHQWYWSSSWSSRSSSSCLSSWSSFCSWWSCGRRSRSHHRRSGLRDRSSFVSGVQCTAGCVTSLCSPRRRRGQQADSWANNTYMHRPCRISTTARHDPIADTNNTIISVVALSRGCTVAQHARERPINLRRRSDA